MTRALAALLVLLSIAIGGSAAAEDFVSHGPTRPAPALVARPAEPRMNRGASTTTDLRKLRPAAPRTRYRPEREEPAVEPVQLPGGQPPRAAPVLAPSAPAPSPGSNFLGLDFNNWGAGHPPDPVGDVGP